MSENIKFGLQLELKGDKVVVAGLDRAHHSVEEFGGAVDNTARSTTKAARSTRDYADAGDDAARSGDRFAQSNQGVLSTLRSMQGLLVTVGMGAFAREMYNVSASAQSSQAALKTLTGSASEAAQVWDELLAFASETPFNLEQSLQAYQALKARGLDPSIEAMRTYADVSAGMGRDMIQFIEAVADAATGEFERLKDFGITARSEGDKVAFTFQGVTDVVEKNAESIEGYLQQLGKTHFADAAADQMDILSGKASNLGDNVTKMYMAFGASGGDAALSAMFDTLSDGVVTLTQNVPELISYAEILVPLIGARLAASVGMSTAELVKQRIAAVGVAAGFGAAGKTVNAYTGAVTRLTAAQKAANLATMGLRGTLALVGGPAGAALMAGAALLTMASNAESSEERIDRLKGSVVELRQELAAMTAIQAQSRIFDISEEISDLESQRDDLMKLIQEINGVRSNPANAGFGMNAASITNRANGGRDLADAQAQLEETNRLLAEQQSLYTDLQSIIDGTYQRQAEGAEGQNNQLTISLDSLNAVIAGHQDRAAAIDEEMAALSAGEQAYAVYVEAQERDKIIKETLKQLGVESVEALGEEGEALIEAASAIAEKEAALATLQNRQKQAAASSKALKQAEESLLKTLFPVAAQQEVIAEQLKTLDSLYKDKRVSVDQYREAKAKLEQQLRELADPLETIITGIREETRAYEEELRATMAGEEALAAYNREKAIESELRRLNAYELSPEEIAQLREEIGARYDAAEALARYKKSVEESKRAQEEANRVTEQFVTEIVGSFIDGADDIGDVFKDLWKRIEREFINSGIAAILGLESPNTPLLSGLGQLASNIPGMLGMGASSSAAGGTVGTGTSAATSAAGTSGFSAASAGWAALAVGIFNTVTDLQSGAYNLDSALNGDNLNMKYADQFGPLGEVLFPSSKYTDPLGIVSTVFGGIGFGGKPGNNIGAVDFNAATGQVSDAYGNGSWNENNGQISSDIATALTSFATAIGGSEFSGKIETSDRGWVRLNGTKYDDAQSLLDDATAQIIENATQIDPIVKQLAATFEGSSQELASYIVNAQTLNNVLKAGNQVIDGVDDLETTLELLGNFSEAGADLSVSAAQLDTFRDLMASIGIEAGDSLPALEEITLALGILGGEEAVRLAAFKTQLNGLQELFATDRIAAFNETQRSTWELWEAQGAAIIGMADVAATEEDFALLTDMVQERYQVEMQLIGEIVGYMESVSDAFSSTFESIFVDGLKTEEERYNYYRDQADALAATISDITDPAELAAVADEYNALLNNAYNALSDGSQDLMREDILTTLTAVNDAIEQQLQAALDAIESDADTGQAGSTANVVNEQVTAILDEMHTTITAALSEAGADQAVAARNQQSAADTMTAAVANMGQWVSALPGSFNFTIDVTMPEVG